MYLDSDKNVFKIEVIDATEEFTDGVIKELSYDDLRGALPDTS